MTMPFVYDPRFTVQRIFGSGQPAVWQGAAGWLDSIVNFNNWTPIVPEQKCDSALPCEQRPTSSCQYDGRSPVFRSDATPGTSGCSFVIAHPLGRSAVNTLPIKLLSFCRTHQAIDCNGPCRQQLLGWKRQRRPAAGLAVPASAELYRPRAVRKHPR